MIEHMWVGIWLGCFLFGYLLGRVDLLVYLSRREGQPAPSQSFFAKVAQTETKTSFAANKITAVSDIDTRVFVAPLATDNITKSENVTIGKTNVVEDDINKSVSKLAQLKGK